MRVVSLVVHGKCLCELILYFIYTVGISNGRFVILMRLLYTVECIVPHSVYLSTETVAMMIL